jgi:hypothetical protein
MSDFAEGLKKSISGDEQTELIKSGTLLVTRGFGVLAVGLISAMWLMDELDFGPWGGLTVSEKFDFIVAVGFMWAIVAAADALARGIATGLTASKYTIIALDPPLPAKHEVSDDVKNDVTARAIRTHPGEPTKIHSILITTSKGETTWADANVVTLMSPD